MKTRHCSFLKRAFKEMRGLDCCASCHEDADEFGYSLSETYTTDGRYRFVHCCKIDPKESLLARGMYELSALEKYLKSLQHPVSPEEVKREDF